MAPRKAAELFYQRYPDAAHYEVTLYGSLAATGKGHMTDVAIMQSIPGIQILWEPHVFKPFHPNGMEFRAYDEAGTETARWLVYSIGGGALAEEKGQGPSKSPLKGDLDPPCPSLKGRELFSPFKGELERVLKGDFLKSNPTAAKASSMICSSAGESLPRSEV